MNLLCIHCGEDAIYIFKGNSLCQYHMDQELKRKQTEEYKNSEIIVINAPEVPE